MLADDDERVTYFFCKRKSEFVSEDLQLLIFPSPCFSQDAKLRLLWIQTEAPDNSREITAAIVNIHLAGIILTNNIIILDNSETNFCTSTKLSSQPTS